MTDGNQFNQGNPNDQPNTGLNIVSFCIPLVGLIIYLVNKDKSPVKAKSAGKFALIGFGVGIVLNIVGRIIGGF